MTMRIKAECREDDWTYRPPGPGLPAFIIACACSSPCDNMQDSVALQIRDDLNP
jgi:hypothetical protein